jgi:hypothetical protein
MYLRVCARLCVALLRLVSNVETLAESFHTPCCIEDTLLASVEGMALGANVYPQLGFGAADGKGVATCAGDSRGHIARMNTGFHAGLKAPCTRVCLSGPHRAGRHTHHLIIPHSARHQYEILTFGDLSGIVGLLASTPLLLDDFLLWGMADFVRARQSGSLCVGLLAAL